MFFTSPEHLQRFLAAMQEIGKIYGGMLDEEYGAALYILTASEGTWQKTSSYVSLSGIDFEAMLEEIDFSGDYSVLIKLASNLFNGNTRCEPVDIATRLDDTNFKVALAALQVRRSPLHFDDLKAGMK